MNGKKAGGNNNLNKNNNLFIYLLENNDYNEIEDDYDNEENTDNYNRGSRSKYIYSFLFIRSTNNIF